MTPFDDAFGTDIGVPTRFFAALVLSLVYGAWRFALTHALAGPAFVLMRTDNPNEMPAVWSGVSIETVRD